MFLFTIYLIDIPLKICFFHASAGGIVISSYPSDPACACIGQSKPSTTCQKSVARFN